MKLKCRDALNTFNNPPPRHPPPDLPMIPFFRYPLWVRGSTCLFFFAIAWNAWACQVPVFRYAIERWAPAKYRVTIVSDGTLPLEDQQRLDALLQQDEAKRTVDVYQIDTTKPLPLSHRSWNSKPHLSLPGMIVEYPKSSQMASDSFAARMPFTKQNCDQLLHSHARQKIANHLLEGDSVCWVLLESGNPEKDAAVSKLLDSELEQASKQLKLPSIEELEIKPEVLRDARVPLRIGFSTVRVQRDDPKESFLIDSLLNSESDLREYDEPMLFPVFGRGVVLYAIIGDGISSETIREAIQFATGPCSCQVKEQNPGFDLLLSVDWNQGVGDILISQPPADIGAPPRPLKIPSGKKSKTP